MKSQDNRSPLPIEIAPDVISFHYISQIESQLLHQLLTTNCTNGTLDANDVKLRWPSTSEHLGHYSRRIRDESEAALIHSVICSHLQLMPGAGHCHVSEIPS